jgi:ankyrin repeat protein
MPSDLNEKLIYACSIGDTVNIRALLARGADVNARDVSSPYKHTPLMMSTRSGHLDIARFLIESKADLNIQSTRGYTALIEAAWFGKLDILRLLIDARAELDAVNYEGNTALMEAASMGHTDIVKELLNAGAHPDRLNKAQQTAMDLAKNEEIKKLIGNRLNIISRISISVKKLSRRQ